MTPKFDNSFDIRDKVITDLKKENKIQQEIIKEQLTLITTLEEQVSELTKLLKEILKS